MKKEIVLLFFAFLLIAPLASAEIMISQPASAYNYGDVMKLNITLNPQANVNGYLSLKIMCESNEAEIHKAVYEVGGNEKKIIYFDTKLDSSVIGSMQGNCLLRANYGGEEKDSQYFIIAKNINVIASVDASFIEPGNSFGIVGNAVKGNGASLNGFVEASSPELNIVLTGNVINGEFRLDLSVPENAAAGTYEINVRAYEKESTGEVANEGNTKVGIIVKPVASSSDVALSTPVVTPGNEIIYTPILVDQGGNDLSDDVKISIYDSAGNVFEEKVAVSGESQIIEIEKDYAQGYWKIAVARGEIKSEKNFYVEELMDASFVLKNGTLTITNVGNVPYTKPIEIVIGNTGEVKELNIGVNEEKRFLLYAPDGNYNVKIRDGDGESEIGSSYLTGSAIAVKDDRLLRTGGTSIIIWIFILLMVGAFAFVKYKRVEKKAYFGVVPTMVRMANTNEKIQPAARLAAFEKESPAPALAGNNRQECALVTIKIKNFDALRNSEGSAPATLDRIMSLARSRKAKIQAQDPFRTAVFVPSLTKEQDNILAAVKFAKEVETILNDHNRKYGQKIDFGIGVNKGDMFVEIYGGSANLTSIGNVSLMARKLAELSEADVLLSPDAFRRTMGVVRAERIAKKGAYKINNIIDRERHSGFIDNFMKRQS